MDAGRNARISRILAPGGLLPATVAAWNFRLRSRRALHDTYCQDLLPTRCLVTAATKEASEAEQEAEVVPRSVVVDLVDIEVAFEQRGYKDERRNKALPEPKPEACDRIVFARRSFGLIRSGAHPARVFINSRTSTSKTKEDFIAIPPVHVVTKHGNERTQNDPNSNEFSGKCLTGEWTLLACV
jgi:hypothetical protein